MKQHATTTHNKRKLSEAEEAMKSSLLTQAVSTFVQKENHDLTNDYLDASMWRLIKVDATIFHRTKKAFLAGDVTVGRKEEDADAVMPIIRAYSWRLQAQVNLSTTDPVEFLED